MNYEILNENDNRKPICENTGKNCYSFREAHEIVNRQKHHKVVNVRINKNKIPTRSYFCKFCKSYHLTSKSFYRDVRYDLNRKKPLREIY